MKGTMMIFAPLSLSLGWVLLGDCLTIHFKFIQQNPKLRFPLDMAEDSVDDMYFGCHDTAKIKKDYFEKEKKPFAGAWKKAERCAQNKLKHKEDEALTKDHLQAICVYTANDLYAAFNDAVRTQGKMYSNTFKFHYLHYMLTTAVQILNSNKLCYTTYRRASVSFTGKVNDIIRFGSFASSSLQPNVTKFGKETCFKIETCSGAFLKNYSLIPKEKEVLIPPYEVFNITKIYNGRPFIEGLTDCKRVYVLKSAGVESKLNCKIRKP